MSSSSLGVSTTLEMSVENTAFMLDRLGQDCAPLQFLRELTQNAIEAIQASPSKEGEIVWDVAWDLYDLSMGELFKLCIIDSGIGMTGDEMVRYINQLSSSVHVQSLEGNFGVGAKIAAATRNHEGLQYFSWRAGVGATIHLWRDPDSGRYGLKQQRRPDGSFGHWARVSDDLKPTQIDVHGTKVVLFGNTSDENTMDPPEGAQSPSRWISKYLNTRYFRFPEGISIKAREGWEYPREDSDRNYLRSLIGQEKYLNDHSDSMGSVELSGAIAHWWILKDEGALSQNSGFVNSSGHMAALYQDELYETAISRAGVARLQQFGVIFGYRQVVIYVEPTPGAQDELIADTARTKLILNGDTLPWVDWAREFRDRMPEPIEELMASVAAGSTSTDHSKSIRERLKQVRELFRLSKYLMNPNGAVLVDPESLAPGASDDSSHRTKSASRTKGKDKGRSPSNLYSLFLENSGVPADPVPLDSEPRVIWVSTADGSRVPPFLEDRAAQFLTDQNLLQINADFRVFTDMVDRWCKFYDDGPGVRETIEDVVKEWFEQTLIETVLGVQSLKESQLWTVVDIENALSEEALSSAVMPRYHIDVAVKRALGSKLGSVKKIAS